MKVSRISVLGLLALTVSIAGFTPDAGAARPATDFDNPPPSNSGFNNKSSEDEDMGGIQGEIEQVITPEYRQRGMRVERMKDRNLRILMPSEVMFAYDSANISREFAPALRQVARIMSKRPRIKALITGHTDSNGSDSYNLDLSMRRAESVADLISAEGIERSRLRTEGRGEQEPIASNATEQGQQQNRRVEMILMRPQRGDRVRRN
ncbi:MAG: OmpA family protein [Candidatus Competibacteraceae bacterium]|nr:OmpA family protein [Candidatus Competibacteraceae bacterium]